MAFQDTTSHESTVRSVFRKIFDVAEKTAISMGQSIMRANIARARYEIVRELQGKSDAELARLNLKRDQIVHHVFRDL